MKSILIGLLFTSLTALCQPSTHDSADTTRGDDPKTVCIAVEKARLLIADALRLRLADSLNNTLAARVQLLEDSNMASILSYTNLLKLSEQKFETQKEITSDFVRLADSWRDQSDYYQKRYKKQRRQKGLLTAGMVGLLVLIIAK